MKETHPHDLTDELQWLASWGARLERLGRCPMLSRWAQADGVAEERGWVNRKFLVFEIGTWAGPIRFQGIDFSAEKAQRAWVINLDLEDTGFNAPYRRNQVVELLGFWKKDDQWWRKGPEWEFLHILADHIEEGNSR